MLAMYRFSPILESFNLIKQYIIMQANTFTMTLEDAYMISPHVKHFIFKTPLETTLNYLPGQFITIYFELDGKELHRSYSIANPPGSDHRIELAAGFVENGPGTTLLFQLNPGDSVQANGPFGRLILKETLLKRYIFVATSTGITPYRAMLPELKQRLRDYPDLSLVFLQGVQTTEDLLYHKEFMSFASECPRVLYRAQLSREKQQPFIEPNHAGYVQQAFPALALEPTHDLVYLCGNPSMIDEAFGWLKQCGFSPQQIIREKYISR